MLLALGPVIGPVNSTVYANPFEERDIPIKGRWPYGNSGDTMQSIGNNPEVTAALINSTLYITGAGCNSDVNVLIIGNGYTYHDTVSAVDANIIVIDRSSAPSGNYALHISNSFGGYLNGNFNI